MGRLWTFLTRCHHHWYSPTEHHEVTCDGNWLHHGAHHGHDDYSRHH